jgi:hypothetical protein
LAPSSLLVTTHRKARSIASGLFVWAQKIA